MDYAQEMLAVASASAGDFHEPTFRGAADSAIPFVPTSSALALPVDTPDSEIAGIVAEGGTPFDEVFAIGDLPAFPSNIDHNTLVVPDALLSEIVALLPYPEEPGGDPDDDGDGDGDGDGDTPGPVVGPEDPPGDPGCTSTAPGHASVWPGIALLVLALWVVRASMPTAGRRRHSQPR